MAIAGVSEVISLLNTGSLTALGVLSEERLPGLDVPTAREQGHDVTLSNWRGLYGPPEMPEYAVAYWQNALGDMVESPTWKQIAERNQFTTIRSPGRSGDRVPLPSCAYRWPTGDESRDTPGCFPRSRGSPRRRTPHR